MLPFHANPNVSSFLRVPWWFLTLTDNSISAVDVNIERQYTGGANVALAAMLCALEPLSKESCVAGHVYCMVNGWMSLCTAVNDAELEVRTMIFSPIRTNWLPQSDTPITRLGREVNAKALDAVRILWMALHNPVDIDSTFALSKMLSKQGTTNTAFDSRNIALLNWISSIANWQRICWPLERT